MNHPTFTTYDYAIGGKMVTGRATFDESYAGILHSDSEARKQIKSTLVHQMAEFMLENNLVEFTQMKAINLNSFGEETVVTVRAYLAPDDQVKILRVAKPIK